MWQKKRTAAKLLLSLGEKGREKIKKLEMVRGEGGVWQPVVGAIIIIITVKREQMSEQCEQMSKQCK